MQLTLYSDYSLRVLLYLSQTKNDRSTIIEIANFYNISKNHLVKVVHRLAQLGYITSIQGKGGGIKLARDADKINIGDVIRKTEQHFHIVECFDAKNNTCIITSSCRLKKILSQAMEAFFNVLDQYNLQECSKDALVNQILRSLAK